ncbi:MAG: type VI secretion system lipoprotein TssJ [Pseudomonadales bacterium]|nr:type VI secretion system lipoprotein TssJ [Pseudomonadales bacterium]
MRLFIVIAFTALLSACGSPALKFGVSSTADINKNEFEEPLAVVVRVYQLKDKRRFENASFDELWKQDYQVLGNDLVMKEEFTMDPAYQRHLELPRHDQAEFLAVMAVYRKPENGSWRDVDEMPGNFITRRFDKTVQITLEKNLILLD